jgi:Tfp pilus assembly protein FimT
MIAKPTRARRAVTIIELVIVTMIMGIMAAVAAPAFFESLLHHRVESAARRVKADLELAAHTARLTSAAQTLTFTGATYTLSAGIKGLDNVNQLYSVNLAGDPFAIASVVANFNSTQAVSFNGYGTPSSGGTVVLHCKGHQCTVTLDAATGNVTITSVHVNGG